MLSMYTYVDISMHWATPNCADDVTNKKYGFRSTKLRRFAANFIYESTPFSKILATPLHTPIIIPIPLPTPTHNYIHIPTPSPTQPTLTSPHTHMHLAPTSHTHTHSCLSPCSLSSTLPLAKKSWENSKTLCTLFSIKLYTSIQPLSAV